MGAAVGGTARTAEDRGEVRFRLGVARLELSPARGSFGRCELTGHLGVEAGRLVAEAFGIERPFTIFSPWIALREVLQLDVRLGRVEGEPAGQGSWYGELSLGLMQPLRRGTYVYEEPRATVHRVPSLGAAFGIALGYRFVSTRTRAVAFLDQKLRARPIHP